MSHDQSSPITKLLDAIRSNHLTGKNIEAKLTATIEEEYAKGDKADIQLIDTCENLLSSLRKDAVRFKSHKAAYHHALDEAAAAKKQAPARCSGRVLRLCAICVLAIVILMGASQPWKWLTVQSTKDQQQFAVQGHEVDASLIKKSIAERERSYEHHAYRTWEEVVDDLGFEPVVPTDFLPDWTVDEYAVLYMPDSITLSVAYIMEDDAQKILAYDLTYFLDISNAYVAYEQSQSGHFKTIHNTNVYISENAMYLNFCWSHGNQVTMLTGDISYDEGVELVGKLIGGKGASGDGGAYE